MHPGVCCFLLRRFLIAYASLSGGTRILDGKQTFDDLSSTNLSTWSLPFTSTLQFHCALALLSIALILFSVYKVFLSIEFPSSSLLPHNLTPPALDNFY